MRYRTVAGTDIKVSELGFGVWTVSTSWWGEKSDAEAVAMLREARDLGVTFYDTANTYGEGRGESILAQAFTPAERADLVYATKFGYDWEHRPDSDLAGHQEAPHRWDPAFLRESLDTSLRRLDTDCIDIWQFHNPRMDALERDDVWTFLDEMKRAGKIRALGVALGPAIGWRDEGIYALRERGVEIVHMIYNALELDPGRDLIQTARETGASLLVRVPHASGMLEGHYTEDTVFPPSDHRSHRPRAWLVNGLKKIRQLDFLTPDGVQLGQAALRYIFHTPAIASAIPNIYNREQLLEFAAASDCPDVTDEQAAKVEALFAANYGLPLENEAGVAQGARGEHARQRAAR